MPLILSDDISRVLVQFAATIFCYAPLHCFLACDLEVDISIVVPPHYIGELSMNNLCCSCKPKRVY